MKTEYKKYSSKGVLEIYTWWFEVKVVGGRAQGEGGGGKGAGLEGEGERELAWRERGRGILFVIHPFSLFSFQFLSFFFVVR